MGLEVSLRGLRGVAQARASYPENSVVVDFDEKVLPESAIVEFIGKCGFSVAGKLPGK